MELTSSISAEPFFKMEIKYIFIIKKVRTNLNHFSNRTWTILNHFKVVPTCTSYDWVFQQIISKFSLNCVKVSWLNRFTCLRNSSDPLASVFWLRESSKVQCNANITRDSSSTTAATATIVAAENTHTHTLHTHTHTRMQMLLALPLDESHFSAFLCLLEQRPRRFCENWVAPRRRRAGGIERRGRRRRRSALFLFIKRTNS